jgi:Lipid A 3-O-deacylase (PagL)
MACSSIRLLTSAALLTLSARTTAAQLDARMRHGDRLLGMSASASFYTAGGSSFGRIRNRNVYLTDLRAEWVLETIGPLGIASTMSVIPGALVTRRSGPLRDCWPVRTGGPRRCVNAKSGAAVGAGVSPLGIKLYWTQHERFRLHGSAATGLMLFSRDVPVAGSRRLNFSADYGAGIDILTDGGSRAIVIGWKFIHVSNAYTARQNPGLDANILSIGVQRRR